MRIAVFTPYYLPAIGGLMYNIQTIAEKLRDRGHEIVIFTCNTEDSPSYENIDNIRIYRAPAWNLLNGTFPVPKPCSVTRDFLKQIQEWRPDVISTQTRFFITTLVGWMLGKRYGIPVVHTERGSRHSVVSSSIVNMISNTYDHIIGYLVTRRVVACTGVSDPACEFVKHLSGRPAIRIPNGIDMNIFPERKDYKEKQIIFVGRLIEAKGVQDVIKALPVLTKKHPGVELLIVGGGPFLKELRNLTWRYNVRGKVKFTGPLKRETVIDCLSKAAVFINPSYSEGLPTSVMEASAMGLPVVATNVGGTSELIDDWSTGILVPPRVPWKIEASLSFMLSDPEWAEAIGKRGRKKMQQEYNWDCIIDKYEEIFKKAAGK